MKLKYIFLSLFLAFLTGLFFTCSEFLEENLDNDLVSLLAPGDSLKTSNTTIIFWWGGVDGADYYNLQIVTPGFNSIEQLIMDTTVSGTQFTVTLFPGTFEWGVAAINSVSSTLLSFRTLVIDSSLNLTGQQVALRTPVQNHATQQTTINFSWDEKPFADNYNFNIYYNEWGGVPVMNTQSLSTTSFSLDLDEGIYVWGVTAENESSKTLAAYRTLYVDTTAPGKPTLIEPLQNDTISMLPVNLAWELLEEVVAPVTDSLWIATDSTFSAIEIETAVTDSIYQASGLSDGMYYWRVRSIDKAGNKGDISETRKFWIYEEQ